MSVLRFRSLSVRRMPGIRDGGFELNELATGVNIVYGPNASGKTTTARVVETLLWPGRAPDGSIWVSGIFELDGARWSAELDAGRARIQRDGEPTGAPHGLPIEASSRYRLELRDLLEAEDRGLARAIGLESAGGYDLAAAASVLNPRRNASRPQSAVAELRKARERLAAARTRQDELQLETATIRSDQQRVAAIPEIEQRLVHLQLALEHASRLRDLQEAQDRLSGFHPVVARLAGDEDTRCSELQRRIAESRDTERVAGEAIARSEEAVRQLAFAENLRNPAEVVTALEVRVATLDRIESELRAESRALEDATLDLQLESERLGPLAAETLARLDLSLVSRLANIAREAEPVRIRRIGLEDEIRLLSAEPDVGNRRALEEGIELLQKWLASAPSRAEESKLRPIAMAASAILLLLGAGLAILHPAALLISVVGAILLSLTLRSPIQPDDRPGLQLRFRETRLAEPEIWMEGPVRALLASLQDEWVAARRGEDAASHARRLTPQLEEARVREAALLASFVETAEASGLSQVDPATTSWLLDRISKWQAASDKVEGTRARLDLAAEQRASELDAAGELLQMLGFPKAEEPAELRAVIQSLDERVRALARADAELNAHRRELAAAQSRMAELRVELTAVLERLQLPEEDITRLGDWCRQRSEYLAAQREADSLDREAARLRQRLEESADDHAALLAADPASIEREIQEQSEAHGELKELQLRVVELRTRVAQATRGHDIEDALAEVDRAESALRQIRDRDAKGAIASVLVDYVEQAARNDQRPEVFHRANALFTQVTRGRYQLLLDDRVDPGFRALDTQLEQSLALEELSSATRLQLLLAVRVGFVEVQEGGVRLPILMDETLANSDDDRASAIIEAVIALASAGRQIFYFTAQRDEVVKWRKALESELEIESRVVELSAVRRQERRLEEEELSLVTEPLPELPAPEGRSHAEFGSILEVPAVDTAEPANALHLWYLLEDPEELHRVMTATRTERWGSLRALLATGAGELISDSLVRKVEALAGSAHAALLRLRVGRGREVDRHALVQSGAVSARFIEEVWEVASEVGGDGVLLLEALERRAVPKFYQKNIQALREFLEETGFVDSRPPLSAATIRWEVLNESARFIQEGIVTTPEIERLLVRLGVAPAWDQPVLEDEIHPRRLQTAFEFD